MIETPADSRTGALSEEEAVEAIVRAGPGGAVVLAGLATAIVLLCWFGFYFLVFLPRSVP